MFLAAQDEIVLMALLCPVFVPADAEGLSVYWLCSGCVGLHVLVRAWLGCWGVPLLPCVPLCWVTLLLLFFGIAEGYAMSEEMDIIEMQSSTACPRQQWN